MYTQGFITITHSPDLRTVCNELDDVKHKAYETGIQLGIPCRKMLVFQQEGKVLSAAVDYWMCGNVESVPITWNSIVEALKSNQVRESGYAKAIEQKYCRKPEKAKGELNNTG